MLKEQNLGNNNTESNSSAVASQDEGPGLDCPPGGPASCVEFVCSPHVCVGFLRLLWFLIVESSQFESCEFPPIISITLVQFNVTTVCSQNCAQAL